MRSVQTREGGKDAETGVDRTLLGSVSKFRHIFGHAIRDEFGLNWGVTHLNHGSYGTAPTRVRRVAAREMDVIESWPDDFFRRNALPRFIETSDAVGASFGAPRGSVCLIENATVAVNTVLRAVAADLRPGDVFLVNDHTYAACRNAVMDTAARAGATVITAAFPLPITSPDELVARLAAEVDRIVASGARLRLVLLDHITSPTAIVLPVAAMGATVKARVPGAVVLVDGAHAPAQIDLDFAPGGALATSVDYYCGNLHKWAFALKGCAFLYTSPPLQEGTQGPSVSHFWRRSYQARFYMQGTNDFSRYWAVPAALGFIADTLGGLRPMREYNSSLVRAGAQLCSARWGTSTLLPPTADVRLCAPFLVPVRTPFDVRDWLAVEGAKDLTPEQAADAADSDDGLNERVSFAILQHARIQAQCVWWRLTPHSAPGDGIAAGTRRPDHQSHGAIFIRLSAQVYNVLDDYARLAQAVEEMAAARARAC